LNLKRKVVLKRRLKKKRKKQNLTSLPSAQTAQQPIGHHPAPARLSLSFSFLFLSLTPGPHSSASPSPPSFLLPSASPACRRSRADSAAPRLLRFLFLPSKLAN
jgi:hypothetical protein